MKARKVPLRWLTFLDFFSVAPFLKLFANAIVGLLVLFCHSCLVNKKLSHRRQRAQRDRNTRTQYQQRLYLSLRKSRLARNIMFSTCPFVRPSVRLFVRSSVTNLWTLYLENKQTDLDVNCHKSSTRARACMNGRPRGPGSQRSRSQKAEVMFGSLAETSFSIPWV